MDGRQAPRMAKQEEGTLGPCGDTISDLDCLPPQEISCKFLQAIGVI